MYKLESGDSGLPSGAPTLSVRVQRDTSPTVSIVSGVSRTDIIVVARRFATVYTKVLYANNNVSYPGDVFSTVDGH